MKIVGILATLSLLLMCASVITLANVIQDVEYELDEIKKRLEELSKRENEV